MTNATNPASSGAPEFRFHVGRAAMLGAGVMVMVTGYTTFKGLLDIVGGNQFYIAFMAVIAIQGMLAISAWFLGQELARTVLRSRLGAGIEPPSTPLTIVTGFIFLFTFSISFAFAFSFWFNQLRGISEQALQARNYPSDFQLAVMKPLRDEVAKFIENDNSGQNSPVTLWLNGIKKIEEVAENEAGTKISGMIANERTSAATTNSEIAKFTKKKDALVASNASLSENMQKIRKSLEDVDREIEPLQKKADGYEQERLKECGGVGNRPSGCGPKAKKAEQERNAVRSEISTKSKPFEPARNRLKDHQRQFDDNEEQISKINVDLAKLVSASPGQQKISNIGLPNGDLESLLRSLRQRRDQFANRGTKEAYDEVVGTCLKVRKLVAQAVDEARIKEYSCESDTARTRTEMTGPALDKARDDFKTKCSPEAMARTADEASQSILKAGNHVDDETIRTSFALIHNKVDLCSSYASAIGVDTSAAKRARDKFIAENEANKDRFAVALDGLVNGGSHRTAAAGIAAVFDLMVLALSFFADLFKIRGHTKAMAQNPRVQVDVSPDPADPAPLAGAKLLLRRARYDMKSGRFVIDTSSADIAALDLLMRDNLMMQLEGFIRSGLARPLAGDRFALTEEAIATLETTIAQQSPPKPRQPAQDTRPATTVEAPPPLPIADPVPLQRREEPSTPTPATGSDPVRPPTELSGISWKKSKRPSSPTTAGRPGADMSPPAMPVAQIGSSRGIADLMTLRRDA